MIALLGLLVGSRGFAAFDVPASWDVQQPVDFRAENFARYDAPWNLLHSLITPDQESRILSDAEGRISAEFGIPPELEAHVRLWFRIYTQYSSREAVIFDEEHPEVIYETVDFRELARTSRNRAAFEIVSRKILAKRIDEYRAAFRELGSSKKRARLSRQAQLIARVRSGLAHQHSPRDALHTLRVQWGQRDAVMTGLLSSSAFLHRMERIFSEMGLPPELTLISLVESSFNWNAVSHAGAVGVWQFMPKTALDFMFVDSTGRIDERLSPIKSTVAAGKLMNRNFRMLGTWPMAISAYNHGHAKWVKLRPAQWSRVPKILAQCSKSRVPFKLGFASRNYYPEFLALLRAYKYQETAYGSAPEGKLNPVRFVQTTAPSTLAALSAQYRIPEPELRRLNPDIKLRDGRIPGGFWLSLPSADDDFSGLILSRRKVALVGRAVEKRQRIAEDIRRIIPRG
jgi:membrane-bound lytic murein transglycosylase D